MTPLPAAAIALNALPREDAPRRTKRARAAATYRAARRNAVRAEHGVWRGAKAIYRPAAPNATSALRVNGVSYPQRRRPARIYKPNGKREIARRLANLAWAAAIAARVA